MNREIIILVLITLSLSAFSQQREIIDLQDKSRYIQIDGIVYDEADDPVRYVNIISRHLRSGTDTDENGIFSLISIPGDTLLFTAIGYKPGLFVVPDDIIYPRYSIDIEMQMDTINIGSVLILPWRTYGEFVHAVIEYSPPEEELIRNMQNNLAIIERQIYADMRVSPEMGYRYAMSQESERVMTMNQTPVNNLLNPFAWGKFIDGIKNGLLRNKKSDKKKKEKEKKNRSSSK